MILKTLRTFLFLDAQHLQPWDLPPCLFFCWLHITWIRCLHSIKTPQNHLVLFQKQEIWGMAFLMDHRIPNSVVHNNVTKTFMKFWKMYCNQFMSSYFWYIVNRKNKEKQSQRRPTPSLYHHRATLLQWTYSHIKFCFFHEFKCPKSGLSSAERVPLIQQIWISLYKIYSFVGFAWERGYFIAQDQASTNIFVFNNWKCA